MNYDWNKRGIRIDDELFDLIKNESKRLNISWQELVRQIIVAYLKGGSGE